MQLNCKVIKKVATPSFLNQRPLPPLFRVIAKFLVLQSDSIFGRGYPPPPSRPSPPQKKKNYGLWLRLVTEGFCSPLHPSNFLNLPMTFDLLYLPKRQFSDEIIWCSETKLWLKVNFSQHVQGYSETSVWFVHVTDIYCSGWRENWRKFEVSFSSHKIHCDVATLNIV